MIQEKDASPPGDERHNRGKNITDVNLSTQKKTGGKLIMGNQGMTNWKFSAFLAIALMLVAGLFSSTAMAGDGDGTISVQAAIGADGTLADQTASGSESHLPAGSTANQLQFTYTIPAAVTDMNDGFFMLEIPQNDGWVVSKKLVTIADDGTTIYQTTGDDTEDTTTTGRDRVEILPKSGDNIRSVKVKLVDTANAADVLVITFATVTASTPRSLDRIVTADDLDTSYRRYKFTASSQKKDGRMTELKARDSSDPPDGIITDDDLALARAYVRVGNVANGQGTVTITPAVAYQSEVRNFSVVFRATGPMYGSTITVQIPTSLHPALPVPNPDSETVGSLLQKSLRINKSSSVSFGDADTVTDGNQPWIASTTTAGLVTIAVNVMNVGNTITVTHRGVTVGEPAETGGARGEEFVVQTNNDGGTAVSVSGVGRVDPAGPEKDNGALYPLAGSGTLTITSTTTGTAAVPIDTTHDFKIQYTSASAKFDSYFIRVELPASTFRDGDGADLTALTTDQHDDEGAENYGWVTGGSTDLKSTGVKRVVSTTGLVVVWGPIKGGSFTGYINNLRTPADASIVATGLTSHVNTGLVTFDTVADPPTATIASGTPAALVAPQPRIFVLQTSLDLLAAPDVLFSLSRTACSSGHSPLLLRLTLWDLVW